MDNELEQLHTYLKTEKGYNGDLNDLKNETKNVNSKVNHDRLQICCKKNFKSDAEYIMHRGIDTTKRIKNILFTPLERSCFRGYAETIQPLIENLYKKELDIEEQNKILCSSLCILIKRLSDEIKDVNYETCYEYLLEDIKENRKTLDTEQYNDHYGYTPLFYAIYYNHPRIVTDLLQTVCLINVHSGVSPIDKVEPESLRRYLDRCITTKINEGTIDNPGINISFDFEPLVCRQKHENATHTPHNESQVIYEMSCSKKFTNLLLHPVIVCFLTMRWQSTKMFEFFFWLRSVFWFLNIILFSIYIISNVSVLKYLSLGIHGCYFTYEVIEDVIMRNFSANTCLSAINLVLIITSSYLDDKWTRYTFFFIIILSCYKLILLFSVRYIYGEMFKVVFYDVVKLLFWYTLILFIPLMFVYNAIFDNLAKENLSKSFFDVFTLLTGNINFPASSDSTYYTAIERFIYVFFVVILPVSLFNLITSKAVNDIKLLEQQSDVTCQRAKIQFIHRTEKVISFIKRTILNIKEEHIVPPRNISGLVNCSNMYPNKIILFNEQIIESLNSHFKDTDTQIFVSSGYLEYSREKDEKEYI